MTLLADVLFVAAVCIGTGMATGAFLPRTATPANAQWWPDSDEDEIPPPPTPEDDE